MPLNILGKVGEEVVGRIPPSLPLCPWASAGPAKVAHVGQLVSEPCRGSRRALMWCVASCALHGGLPTLLTYLWLPPDVLTLQLMLTL